MHHFTYCHRGAGATEYWKTNVSQYTLYCSNLGQCSSLLAENNIDPIRVCVRTLNTPVGTVLGVNTPLWKG